jgi:3-oxoacyl-[acyl-carrier-protein] synthase III
MSNGLRHAHIVGWGKYTPERVMTNDDLSKLVDTTDKWIRERTGIAQRHVANTKETCAHMATIAALDALDVANISPAQVGLIIVATSTPDFPFPATACLVQDALGADNAGAFDLSAACSGFIYGLSLAADAIKSHSCDYALVIGSELMTNLVDWSDRNTCVLFGDGAGAVVLQGSDQPGGILSTLLRADGSGGEMLYVRNHRNEKPEKLVARAESTLGEAKMGVNSGYVQMNGREVFRFATRILDKATREIMHKAGWQADQVDLLVPHQANSRIIEAAAKSLSIPLDRFYSNIERYGNTSAASIPIAICEAVTDGRLRPNDKVVLVGFGAGLTWAAAAVQWGTPRTMNQANRRLNRLRLGAANVRSRARRVIRRLEDRLFGTIEPTLTPLNVSPAEPPKNTTTPEP